MLLTGSAYYLGPKIHSVGQRAYCGAPIGIAALSLAAELRRFISYRIAFRKVS